MEEFTAYQQELNDMIVESTLLFSHSSERDSRVDTLYDEYMSQKEISDLLLISEKDYKLSRLCAKQTFIMENEVPLLPKITSFEYVELLSELGELAKKEYIAETYAINVNISPLTSELNKKKYIVKDDTDTIIELTIVLSLVAKLSYKVNYIVKYHNKEYFGELSLKECEEMKICFKVLQYFKPDLSRKYYAVDSADESFDTDIVLLNSSSPVSVMVNCDIYRMDIPTLDIYMKPDVIVERLFTFEDSDFALRLQSADKVRVEVYDGAVLDDISVNSVELSTIIEDPDYDYNQMDKQFVNKMSQEYLVRASKNQEAFYNAEVDARLDEARSQAESSIQLVLVDTAQTLISILQVLEQISKWGDVNHKIQAKSLIGTTAVMVNVNLPRMDVTSTLKPGSKMELVEFSPDAGAKDWYKMRVVTPEFVPIKESLDANLTNIFSDERYLIVIKYTVKAIHGYVTKVDVPEGKRLFEIITSYNVSSGYTSRSVGTELRQNVNVVFPFAHQQVDYELSITHVAVLDTMATTRIGEISGRIDINVVFMSKEVSVSTSNIRGVEVTMSDKGTLFGYGADVQIRLQDKLPKLKCVTLKGVDHLNKINSCNSYQIHGGLWTYVPATATSIFQGDEEDGYVRGEFTTEFKTDGGPLTISGRSSTLSKHISSDDITYARFSDGKTLKDAFGKEDENEFLLCLNNFGVAINSDVSYKAQTAPITLAETFYLNQYNTVQDKINWQLSKDVSELSEKLEKLEDKVERLSLQIEALNKQLNPPIYMLFINEIVGALTAKLITMATTKALQAMSEMIGPLRRIAAEVYDMSANAAKMMRPKRKGYYPVDQTAMMTLFVDDVADALGKKSELRLKREVSRPAYKSGIHSLQLYDMSEKIDVVTGYFSRGRLKSDVNLDLLRPEFNTKANGIPMPEFKVFYKPLDALGPLKSPVHDVFTKQDQLRRELMSSKRRKTHLRPSHSYCTYEDYKVLENGVIRKELIFMGVGEFNGGGRQIGGGIGGLTIKYDSTGIDRVSDVRVFKPLSFEECGYKPNEVSNMYLRLYKPKISELNDLTPQKQWAALVADVDRKVQSGDIMFNTYVPDSSIGESYKSLVKNPPDFQYSLLFNNCQSFTNSLINFQLKGTIDPSWPSDLITAMVSPRVRFINEALNDATTAIKDHVIRSRRDLSNLEMTVKECMYYNKVLCNGVYFLNYGTNNVKVRFIKQ